MPCRTERGQVLPLIAVFMVLCGLAALALGRVGGRLVSRARASVAADAAALAGARSGERAARRLAADNHGALVTFQQLAADVRVEVEVGGERASARARLEAGTEPGGAGAGTGPVPAPAMRAALARAKQVLGGDVGVAALEPGGLVIDVEPSFVGRLAAAADTAGLCQVEPTKAPARFGICRPPPSATDP